MAWAAGHSLQNGKYTIEKVLGEGRFGITYLAKDAKGERVVIKTLGDALLNDSDFNRFQQNFVKEAFKLAKYQHPHIVRMLEEPFLEQEPSQNKELWCIAMEYVAGIDLAHRQSAILSIEEARCYIQQIGEALMVVHQHQMVHRDVKPANIMIRSGKSEAVLIDFGLARDFDRKLSVSVLDTEAEPNFAAPELYSRTAELRAYTDIYSLAATLYNLLTGKLPTSAKERQLNNTPLKPPKEINPQISDKVNRAILRGMKLDAKKRPESVEEWLDDLGWKREAIGDSNPQSKAEADIQTELAKQQVKLGVANLWIAVGIGILSILVTVLLAMYGDQLKSIFVNPDSPPSSEPSPATPSKPQNSPIKLLPKK